MILNKLNLNYQNLNDKMLTCNFYENKKKKAEIQTIQNEQLEI
jgi:hypothetical protein